MTALQQMISYYTHNGQEVVMRIRHRIFTLTTLGVELPNVPGRVRLTKEEMEQMCEIVERARRR